ncbi:MAG: hypothetical protein P1U56_07495 [Saprospiraceae bacterium]|nr:hypothetical protein [Saprospiraceae bacterium]
MKKSIWVSFVLTVLCYTSTKAQDDPFKGGSGDGYSLSEYVNTTSFVYVGGQGDGFSYSSRIDLFNDSYKGGEGDGFTSNFSTNNFFDFTKGGQGDGNATAEYYLTFIDTYKGGVSDGFGFGKHGHTVYWTGLVGTGWNVEGNWENNIIPEYCNPVVIPANVPNFPFVNSGVFRIGYHTNVGDYMCEKLKVDLGAEITTRVNCTVENYNTIVVLGKFFARNSSSGAFINSTNGVMQIKSAGAMIFKQ